jgi:hypothetical protein
VHTYASALDLIGVTVPQHLAADAEVPVLTGPQAQGDLLIMPIDRPAGPGWSMVPVSGVPLVQGEATSNTHWLHRGFDSPGVLWLRPPADEPGDDDLIVAWLRVPDGQAALLIHTDEHGANGIGPGEYVIKRKRQIVISLSRVRERAAPAPAPTPTPTLTYVID